MGYSAVCGSRCEDSANVWSQVFESYLLKKKTLRATAMEIDSEFHQYPGAWYCFSTLEHGIDSDHDFYRATSLFSKLY